MSVVQGKNVVLTIVAFWDGITFTNGVPFSPSTERVIACARSVTLTTTTSLIETTTVGTGKGATFKPQKNVTTGSLEGVVFLNEKNKVALPWLRSIQLAHALVKSELHRTADDGSEYKDLLNFWITNITDTGSVGDFNTFQMDFQVEGDPVITLSDMVEAQRAVEWKYAFVVPLVLSAENLPYNHRALHIQGGDISISLSDMPPNRFLIVRYPADEANYTTWFNTQLNNGTIPDSVFISIQTVGEWKYIITRNETTFDNSQPLKFSR